MRPTRTIYMPGLAYLQLRDTAKAKAAYQDFFTLWKDADPDVPILKQAKAEYANLQKPSRLGDPHPSSSWGVWSSAVPKSR